MKQWSEEKVMKWADAWYAKKAKENPNAKWYFELIRDNAKMLVKSGASVTELEKIQADGIGVYDKANKGKIIGNLGPKMFKSACCVARDALNAQKSPVERLGIAFVKGCKFVSCK